jgi:hypothetical protein
VRTLNSGIRSGGLSPVRGRAASCTPNASIPLSLPCHHCELKTKRVKTRRSEDPCPRPWPILSIPGQPSQVENSLFLTLLV